ncbi:MAG: ABC transporter permease [Colwellia sp.]|nr:ABC transporter permease [Colwellia sp.]
MLLQSALCNFKRAKQYYLTTVFTLAITLSMVLSVFSLVDLVFFAPLPYQNSENLYQLEGSIKSSTFDGVGTNVQLIKYVKDNNTVFSDLATYHTWSNYKLYDQVNRPEVPVLLASHNIFDLLGVSPELGRLFSEKEKYGNKQPVIILGYRAWQKHYQGDDNIIGKKIQLNQRRFMVIGVAPDNLVLPQYENINESFWIPMDMDEVFSFQKAGQYYMGAYKGVARIKKGFSLEDAKQQASALALKGAELHTPSILQDFSVGVKITLYKEAIQGDSGNIVLMLLVGVVLLMVIALINLSSMQLARAVAKIKTVAISFAFGASNKQLLIESFKHNILVIGLAVLLALVLTSASFSVIHLLANGTIQRLDSLQLSFNILILAVVLAIVIALLYSYIELSVVKEKTLTTSLQSSGKGVGKQMSAGASHLLIGLQIMLSFVVLVVASHVAWQTLSEALRDNGIETNSKWSLTLNYANIKKSAERENIHKSLMSQLKQASAVTNLVPISEPRIPKNINNTAIYDENNNYLSQIRRIKIAPNYLSELKLEVTGEQFKARDNELKNYPVIINQRLADLMSDDFGQVIGHKITLDKKNYHQIIGVTANTYVPGAVHYEAYELYVPKQYQGSWEYSFLLTASDNSTIEQQVRDLVTKLDSRLDIAQLITLEQQFDEKRQRHLTAAWLAIILAVVSLLMVVIGVNGIVNYMVQVRRYDLGVKLAMGASNSRLLKDSLGELMLPIVISLFFAFSLSFLGLGYSRSQPDLTVNANWLLVTGIILGFICISLLASYFPVRKILSNDPVKALRNE